MGKWTTSSRGTQTTAHPIGKDPWSTKSGVDEAIERGRDMAKHGHSDIKVTAPDGSSYSRR